MRGQTKIHSLYEQIANTTSGFILSILIWAYIAAPYLDMPYKLEEGLVITSMFTVASVIRGYLWRRCGNYITERRKINGIT